MPSPNPRHHPRSISENLNTNHITTMSPPKKTIHDSLLSAACGTSAGLLTNAAARSTVAQSSPVVVISESENEIIVISDDEEDPMLSGLLAGLITTLRQQHPNGPSTLPSNPHKSTASSPVKATSGTSHTTTPSGPSAGLHTPTPPSKASMWTVWNPPRPQ